MNQEFSTITEADFYGVDNVFFKLGDTVYEAVEDESDGYRSCLDEIRIASDAEGLIFFRNPLARVRVEDRGTDSQEGWLLRDVVDSHIWLEIGTDNNDDYYPYFIFRYYPKENK